MLHVHTIALVCLKQSTKPGKGAIEMENDHQLYQSLYTRTHTCLKFTHITPYDAIFSDNLVLFACLRIWIYDS